MQGVKVYEKINKLLTVLSIFLSVILLLLRSYAVGVDAEEINYLSDNEKAKVEEFIEKQMDKGKIPGMSVVIVKGDKTVYETGFGY